MDIQDTFRKYLGLVGTPIQVGLHGRDDNAQGSVLKGIVRNAMFDSFLLETTTGNRVIRFEDVVFVDEA